MGEVHVDGPEAINFHLGPELWYLVQSCLLGSPVVALSPEVDRFAHHSHCHPVLLAPLVVGIRGGKAGEFELLLKELELRLWNVDL